MKIDIEMKQLCIRYYMIITVMSVFTGCYNNGNTVPVGDWDSTHGRPMIRIEKTDVGHSAIVFHRTYSGDACPIEYPLVVGSQVCIYRQKGG